MAFIVDETTDVDHPTKWECGKTEMEAIGRLVVYRPDEVKIDLVRNAPLQDTPRKSSCAAHGTEKMYNGVCCGTHRFPPEEGQ